MAAPQPVVCSAGEGGLLVRFGTGIDLEVNEAVLECLARMDESSERPVGVSDILPTYAALLVHFDPLVVDRNSVAEWCNSLLKSDAKRDAKVARHIEIPVQYGGQHGLDIDEVARLTGLGTAEEVARIHSQGDYRVYFLGFLGGFPYLGGLQAPLTSVPRLATPREKLLPGTVGIAGGQTGVYTVESPGGWHLLGKTSKTLFDPTQDPPAMLRAGDLVKFVPVQEDATDPHPNPVPAPAAATNTSAPTDFLEVIVPGPQTTVQDLGRVGYARHGVGRAGAADGLALRMGNSLVGNTEGDAGLEVLMGGLTVRLRAANLSSVVCAVTGAACPLSLVRKGRGQATALHVQESFLLREGDELQVGFATDGLRSYLCVAGGVQVAAVLGSRATDVRGRVGGVEGRAVQAGDCLGLGVSSVSSTPLAPRLVHATAHDPLRQVKPKDGGGGKEEEEAGGVRVWWLRVLPGPGDPSQLASPPPSNSNTHALCAPGRAFRVLPKSDRMAVCLRPASDAPPLQGGQQLSEPCVSGTVQLPPDGNPVILLAEHQTTGGYKVAGTVIQADLWRLGQMRPQDLVRFVAATEDEAVTALREVRNRWARETQPVAWPLLASEEARATEVQAVRGVEYALVARGGRGLKRIDLNADAGEGFDDETLLKYVTSVNVACGGHVGDAGSMARTVALAVAAGAGIGAHVSYVDREGFGRTRLDTAPSELFEQMLSQAGALVAVCRAAGRRVRYMKPHGALYHTVMEGGEQGGAVWAAARLLGLPLLLMPRSEWATFGEGFSERAYDSNGKAGSERDEWYTLRPRGEPGAVIHDPAEAAQQAMRLAALPRVHSVCVHSDSPNAAKVAQAVRAALDSKYRVGPFCTPESDFGSAEKEEEEEEDGEAASADAQQLTTTLQAEAAPASAASGGAAEESAVVSSRLRRVLEQQVAPLLLRGYRTGEGCEPDVYPQARACEGVEAVMALLAGAEVKETAYARYARGLATYEEYIADLRQQLRTQGGGWVTVAPRDTCQQGNDSESAAISDLSRRNAEAFATSAGCVGYEIGGAQYQAALMRGFDPAAVLRLGLPSSMPAHSLQRAQYVNGLAELSAEVRQGLFQATAQVVVEHYRGDSAATAKDTTVPWHPYNFHAGNFVDEASGFSPLDATTAELVDAGCWPMPCWVFSPKFSLHHLDQWTRRQIAIFNERGRTLHCVRIKNPGQGKAWTAAAVWEHCAVVIKVFASSSDASGAPLPAPIIYIHNHDLNGAASHVGAELLRTAQAAGFRTLVVDAAYRKNGTHNDNTVIASALTLDETQLAALEAYNRNQQAIEKVLCRFDSRTSQMTPWDSEWAGGTEGSDLRIAKEFGLDAGQIERAKRVASALFPLERAVTPFSEYRLRLGIGILIEDGIEPKTEEAARDWVMARGGKIKVGGEVLLGLKRWETLVAKPPEVDKLLENMSQELAAAVSAQTDASKRVVPSDVPGSRFSASQRMTALGFQHKGLAHVVQVTDTAADLFPLLAAPHVLHRQPRSLPAGTKFEVLTDPSDVARRTVVQFGGFRVDAETVTVAFSILSSDNGGGSKPNKQAAALEVRLADREAAAALTSAPPSAAPSSVERRASGVRKADRSKFPREFASEVPGEVVALAVSVGDVLQAQQALCTLESMKMEMHITAPAQLDGRRVVSLAVLPRSATAPGDLVSPGDLLIEVE